MNKMGRPKEKVDAKKLTLLLDEDARIALDNLSKLYKKSRSKVVEMLAIAANERLCGPLSNRRTGMNVRPVISLDAPGAKVFGKSLRQLKPRARGAKRKPSSSRKSSNPSDSAPEGQTPAP